jgi:hypothetical protein
MYLLQYWDLRNRYTQFTSGGKLPDSYDFWRRQAPTLHVINFDEIVANDIVILGSAETVASMKAFGAEVVPRISQVLDRDSGVRQKAAASALHEA